MNGISSFVVSFCAATIVLGGLYMLCGNIKLSNSVRYVFCLCFICSVLGATALFSNIKPSIKKTEEKEIVTEDKSSRSAELIFETALESEGIEFSKIIVNTDKSDSGNIFITEVIVYSNEDANKIREVIGEGAYDVRVVNG